MFTVKRSISIHGAKITLWHGEIYIFINIVFFAEYFNIECSSMFGYKFLKLTS